MIVDGDWSAWGSWGTCSLTCGVGQKTRSRTCTSPAPAYGGNNCTGNSTDTASCNVTGCPGNSHGICNSKTCVYRTADGPYRQVYNNSNCDIHWSLDRWSL